VLAIYLYFIASHPPCCQTMTRSFDMLFMTRTIDIICELWPNTLHRLLSSEYNLLALNRFTWVFSRLHGTVCEGRQKHLEYLVSTIIHITK
jgi:hypothetical protein